MIHEATRYTRYQSYKQHDRDAMEIKINFRITLIINYMMAENLFFNAFLSRSSIYYIMLNLDNLINPLNVVGTNIFSWASNFTSPTTWYTNELRRLESAQ